MVRMTDVRHSPVGAPVLARDFVQPHLLHRIVERELRRNAPLHRGGSELERLQKVRFRGVGLLPVADAPAQVGLPAAGRPRLLRQLKRLVGVLLCAKPVEQPQACGRAVEVQDFLGRVCEGE